MKHAFYIYPALFVLSPVAANFSGTRPPATEEPNQQEDYFSSFPVTYWGECFSKNGCTQLIVNTKMVNKKILAFEYPPLQPVKYQGVRYTLTYIPVLN